ncbi:RNase J family beta-CASP ribonuclease [Candidatus Uhrbacteria bacterium]|nr:RNase J family beta-CASP ribonuclease [Candidatus Uhrbacteria bacterium]
MAEQNKNTPVTPPAAKPDPTAPRRTYQRPTAKRPIRPAAERRQPTGAKPPRPANAAVGHPIKNPAITPSPVTVEPPNGKVLAPKLKIYALGGLEEIGRNCTVFECGADIVIIDIGLMFPEEGMPGIDYIIPNISSLKGKEQNIRGVLVTHGHMDHVGGIPLTMPKLGWPTIFTTPLTAGIIRKRQEEFRNESNLRIQMVKSGERIRLGRHFIFEPFHVNHNISDAFGSALHTPYGTIIYTGDFKFDFTPVMDEPADLPYIAQFGTKGVLAMMSDSTNAESPGYQMSERQVGAEMDDIFQKVKGRLIIGTFSSLLTRVQQIITLSEKYGRKVIVEGRSMKNIIELAHSLGYLKMKPGTIVDDKSAKHLADHQIAVVCTGAQGEKNAALMRIANKEHRVFQIRKGDSVVFSSSVIPGNERTVQNLKDTLVRQGAHIFHYKNLDVHAGGHAKQEDLKLMMRLIKPKYLIPAHGNRFMLEAHAELAREVGIPDERILVAENGQVIEFDAKGGQLTKTKVDTDYVMVDGLGVGDVSEVVLRDRRMLAEDGIFVIIATVEKRTGKLVGSPDIISRGFVYMRENKELINQARDRVRRVLKDNNPQGPAFEEHLKNKVRNEIGAFLFKATERRPMVLPVIIEV